LFCCSEKLSERTEIHESEWSIHHIGTPLARSKNFLESRQLNPLHVAVELNGEIVRKKDFEIVTLKEEDIVEIVSFVGGG